MTKKLLNKHILDFKKFASQVIKIEAIDPWMKKKNKAFDNRTPIQVIKDGEKELLYNMIYDLGSGTPS